MAAPVIHFEVLGKNGAKLQEFYSSIFNWNINADNPMKYGLVEAGEGGIGGGVGDAAEGQPPMVTFYIGVDDPQAYLDAVEAKGGKTVMPVTEIPGMVTIAMFSDPEGNVIGLVKNA